MRRITQFLCGVAALVYVVVFGRFGLGALLFFAPFILPPFAFVAYLVTQWHSRGSQITCLVGTISYSSWCAYFYSDVAIRHPDPQSPIALLFVGIYAAPVLLVLFWIAYALEWHHQARNMPAAGSS
jgi:hypothetical protein